MNETREITVAWGPVEPMPPATVATLVAWRKRKNKPAAKDVEQTSPSIDTAFRVAGLFDLLGGGVDRLVEEFRALGITSFRIWRYPAGRGKWSIHWEHPDGGMTNSADGPDAVTMIGRAIELERTRQRRAVLYVLARHVHQIDSTIGASDVDGDIAEAARQLGALVKQALS